MDLLGNLDAKGMIESNHSSIANNTWHGLTRFTALLVSAIATQAAFADVMLDTSLDSEISAASFVTEARIVEISAKCERIGCRDTAYGIKIIRNLYIKDWLGKDWTPPQEITVCAQPGLELGQTYAFLLYPVNEIGKGNPKTEIDESAGKCTYANNLGAVFYNHGGAYYRIGSPESIELIKDDRGTFLTQGKLEERFLERVGQLAKAQEN